MYFREQDKLKAITFSFDDGMIQDVRLIELLNKYNLKATFNLNSELFGKGRVKVQEDGRRVPFYQIKANDVRTVYEGHEIAVHTLTHPRLTELDDAEVIRQVEQDRLNLSELAGYEVIGMAYPCGGVNYDDRVVNLIREHTGVKYARNIQVTDSFDPQTDLFRYHPTLHHVSNAPRRAKRTRDFIEMETDKPQVLYIWGHSYELDLEPDRWAKLEELFAYLGNRDDIFYGTNKEVLL